MSESEREEPLGPDEVDEKFRELVGGLEDSGAEKAIEKEAEADRKAESEPDAAAEQEPVADRSENEEPGLLDLWDAELPEDEEDREEYVPPEPPPIPWPSLHAIGGVVSILVSLVILFRPQWLPFPITFARLVGIGLFAVGVWLLINRLKDDRDETDDGAVV
ncbi:hypothetical protein [Salininema proteolyticum]|uniref:Uncharacterized protein n=1 Tax=Salininema proteolyticum TaxID=1607685 RepID=A0ABV8TVD6_9ACTN